MAFGYGPWPRSSTTSAPAGSPAFRRHRDPGPPAGRRDRDRFVPGKSKQNAVKTTVVTDGDGRVFFCSPTRPGSCADTNHARRLGLVELLTDASASSTASPT
ncbi:transposase family protein [Streptomyces griseomycini]|uniref:transposase family protein n=1 Tax=Streptomyces griseomycini TaxID=66895 RepID=UPI003570D9E0